METLRERSSEFGIFPMETLRERNSEFGISPLETLRVGVGEASPLEIACPLDKRNFSYGDATRTE
jgi:hypothetical protein